VDLAARSALLEGRVELRREQATLRCQRLELRFDAQGQVLWARGAGGVLVETPELRAEAEEATFELAQSRVQLRGPVRAQQGGLKLEAAGASVDLFGQQLELTEVRGSVGP
jgi:lipopolysaccharide export system protein LptA